MKMCESKPPRPSDDAVFLRKEIINAINRSDEKPPKENRRKDGQFPQSTTKSVGTQLREMNSTIEKMKEEGGDRYRKIDERIADMEKFSMIDETSEIKADGPSEVHEDQNHGKAVATRFYGDTCEQEFEQFLRETLTEIGMSTENAKIECPAKPATHAFICFKDSDERSKCVRSANMLRKGLRGRTIMISRSMGAEGRFCSKRLRFFQMLHSHETQHSSQSDFMNWIPKYVSDNGQLVVRTCSNPNSENKRTNGKQKCAQS